MKKLIKKLNKSVKKLDVFDLELMAWAGAAFALLMLNLLPEVVAWMEVQHWVWFLGAFVLLALRPCIHWFK